jgi:hypothetical protein
MSMNFGDNTRTRTAKRFFVVALGITVLVARLYYTIHELLFKVSNKTHHAKEQTDCIYERQNHDLLFEHSLAHLYQVVYKS